MNERIRKINPKRFGRFPKNAEKILTQHFLRNYDRKIFG